MTHLQGGCLCGAIRFRVLGAPASSVICHCRSCRKASGAPSVAWLTFERGRFQLTQGVPRRFASSPGVVRTFCADCGSPLTYASELSPGTIDVSTISLDDPSLFPPTQEEWLSHKLAWEIADESRIHYPQDPTDGSLPP
jgi:hypothetical protein